MIHDAPNLAHPNGFELDCFAVDENVDFAPRVRAHVAKCERCRGRVGRFRSDRAHFAATLGPTLQSLQTKLSRKGEAKAGRWKPWSLLPVAAALALVSLRALGPAAAHDLHPALAIKGDPAFTLYVHRNGRASPFVSGGSLSPGDPVRFVLRPSGFAYVLVVSIDASSHASVYFPFDGAESGAIQEADEIALSGGIALDATPGPERIYALFSHQPLRAADALDALATVRRGGVDAIRRQERLAVPADAQSSVLLENAGAAANLTGPP